MADDKAHARKLRVLAKASTSALVFAESAKRAALSSAEVFQLEVVNDELILRNDLHEVRALFDEEHLERFRRGSMQGGC